MKKYVIFFLKLFFGAGLLVWLLLRLDTQAMWGVLKGAKAAWLIAVVGVYCAALIVNAFKWRVLLKALGIASKTWDLFNLNLLSVFYGAVLPGGQLTGEAVKCYRIAKGADCKQALVASVVMDRLTGLVPSVWLGLIGILLTAFRFPQRGILIGILAVCSIISSGIFLLTSSRAARWTERMADKISARPGKGLVRYAMQIVRALFSYRGSSRSVWRAIVLGAVFQILCAVCGVFIANSIGAQVGLIDMLWVTSLVSLVLIIPVSILGIGLREGAFVVFLGMISVAPEKALCISFLNLALVLFWAGWGVVVELFHHAKPLRPMAAE